VVSADDTEPQVNPHAPEGAAEEGAAAPPVETPSVPASPDDAAPLTPASTSAPEAADAAGNPTAETPADEAPAADDPAAPENTPAETSEADGAAATPAASGGEDPAPAEAAPEASGDTPAGEGDAGEASSGAAEGSSEEAPAGDAPSGDTAEASSGAADGGDPAAQGEGDTPAAEGDQPTGEGEGDQPAAEGQGESDQPAAEGESEPKDGEGAGKRKRRPRGRRQNRGGQRGGPGGRRRFQWDEVFLRQRLEILRAMDPDPKAIEWAVNAGGRFDVADILAGEGSSGREFGRRAYAATPETDDQAAWIILSAVRARDIVPIARQAVSGTTDQREQVKAAIEKVGIARVNPALQGERPAQQVFAERAQRVDLTTPDGEEQKAAWALLSLARPQDVKFAASPPRPRPGGPGGRPGGPGRPGGDRFGGDDRRGRRREPGIPGGKFSVGESGIGGELGAKLRAALEAAENNEVADTRDQK